MGSLGRRRAGGPTSRTKGGAPCVLRLAETWRTVQSRTVSRPNPSPKSQASTGSVEKGQRPAFRGCSAVSGLSNNCKSSAQATEKTERRLSDNVNWLLSASRPYGPNLLMELLVLQLTPAEALHRTGGSQVHDSQAHSRCCVFLRSIQSLRRRQLSKSAKRGRQEFSVPSLSSFAIDSWSDPSGCPGGLCKSSPVLGGAVTTCSWVQHGMMAPPHQAGAGISIQCS
jgi:hypothetical protein